ncbi:MAG: ribonuclease P protein component [Deltaproteobacteria bacterium]|jgi:ribonuclease P protein component|nr:ribonuclease P protein component [Deltaproteobacteria bacterium]
MGQGYPKEVRLRKRGDYLRLSKNNTARFFLAGFLVAVRPNGGPVSRLGVIVTRKLGRAVLRNCLKRRVREFFRLCREKWPAGLDILFIACREHKDHPWPPAAADLVRLEKFLRKNEPRNSEPRNSDPRNSEPRKNAPRKPGPELDGRPR